MQPVQHFCMERPVFTVGKRCRDGIRVCCVLECLYSAWTYKVHCPLPGKNFHTHLLSMKNIRRIPISLASIMTDQSTTATVAVGVVTVIFGIPGFLIGGKALLQCLRKKRSRISHQGQHYKKTFIFASNKLCFVQGRPTNLFCQHPPMTAREWTILMRITKHKSSVTTMCPVSLEFMSLYPRMSIANTRVLPQNRSH
jgi:hypothetical protein